MMEEVKELIRITKDKVAIALQEQANCVDFNYSTYINADLWCNGCKLGRLYRISENIRDIAVWARKMVDSVGEDIIPFMGGYGECRTILNQTPCPFN